MRDEQEDFLLRGNFRGLTEIEKKIVHLGVIFGSSERLKKKDILLFYKWNLINIKEG